MKYKERIGWFLALQRILKLSHNRVAPALPNSKRHSKLPEREISRSIPTIPYQSMSFVHQAKLSRPMQTPILYHRDNVQIKWLNGDADKSVSSTSILPISEGRALPKPTKLTTKLDRSLVVTHTLGSASRRQQVRIEQLTGVPKLPMGGAVGSDNFMEKSFAPEPAHPPSPFYVNDESQEATLAATHRQIESLSSNQDSRRSKLNVEHSFPHNLNVMPTAQGRETSVDQNYASSSSNTSASTVHLDGLSLGRWAIQHLERVLSKPPSGMTGVDPRAIVPRSRVAPF